MNELEPRGENIGQKPFVIRGHHLLEYVLLIKAANEGLSQAGMETWNVTFQKLRQQHEHLVKKSPSSLTGMELQQIKYIEDVFGLSLEQADRVMEDYEKIGEKFLKLSDDYPIELVEGKPDHICEVCVIGKHCQQLHDNNAEDYFNFNFSGIKGDRQFLNEFVRDINLLHLPQPIINYEMTRFSNAEPQLTVRRIRTTMEVVRRVFKGGMSAFWQIETL